MGSESVSSDHIKQAQAIPGFVHPKPQPTYTGTDLDVVMLITSWSNHRLFQ